MRHPTHLCSPLPLSDGATHVHYTLDKSAVPDPTALPDLRQIDWSGSPTSVLNPGTHRCTTARFCGLNSA